MQVEAFYSHLNGYEYIQYHKPHLWNEICSVVSAVDAEKCRTKVSKEKDMKGRLLYSPKDMNAAFDDGFSAQGWKEQRTSYWVTRDVDLIRETLPLTPGEQKARIEEAGEQALYSFNQTDFVKDGVAVEVQFGKYAFVAYDLFVKHMAFYVGNVIDVGVEILPMSSLQKGMSSGPAYYEGELYNLIREGRGVPAVPLVIIGISP